MKRNYVPTEADRLTGEHLRDLRNRRGETLAETTERSGFGKDRSTLAATERGERRLTEIEATKLAAHFGTTASQLFKQPKRPALLPAVTEQAFLGNPEEEDLFSGATIVPIKASKNVIIDRDNPMTPEQYRAEVWVPYLEARYAADQQKTA